MSTGADSETSFEMAKQKHSGRAPESDRELTEEEQAAISRFGAEKGMPRLQQRLKVVDGKLEPDHPNRVVGTALLMAELGVNDLNFFQGLLSQLANASAKGSEIDSDAVNFMASVIIDIKPRDHIEAMLAAQMASVHMATMSIVRQFMNAAHVPQQDTAGRQFNQLSRTFGTLVETLKRYRTGGEQKVTVQHVSVSEGGQAIVGNVMQAPGTPAPKQSDTTSSPALTHSKLESMPVVNEPIRPRERVRRKSK